MEMAPELNLPSITVSYNWGTTSPEVMEKEVTRNVEQAVTRLRGVQKVKSITRAGRSSVTVTFTQNTPVDYRVVELQEYLSALEKTLPEGVRQGSISRRVPEQLSDMQTFMVYSISGQRPIHDLLEYAQKNIRLHLLGIDGLAEIEINGARAPALTVEFNTDKLEKLELSPGQLLRQIRQKLSWRSAGYTQAQGRQMSLLVPPQVNSLNDIRNMPVALPQGRQIIRLSEIAYISIQDYPASTMKRINGKPALTLRFVKESGADAIALAEQIRGQLAQIQKQFPVGITLQLEHDATEQMREQFGQLQFQALISLLVVFLVLLIFIRRFRAPFVILGSILFSLLLSIATLFFLDYTLNVITLAGLTVALGMIVDNAVIVFEECNPGLPSSRSERFKHIKKLLSRTIVPVLGGTLTTVGIFIPVLFTLKKLQLFLFPLAVAITLTLVASVIIALTWIPYSLIWLVPDKREEKASPKKKRKNLFVYIRKPALLFLNWRHKLRWVVYVGLLLLIGLPTFAIKEPDWEKGTNWPEFTKIYFDNRSDIDPLIGGLTYRFFKGTYFGSPWGWPKQKSIYITIRTPQGTPIDEINKMAQNYEKIVKPYEEAFSYYETYVSEYYGARMQFYIKDDYLNESMPYIFYAQAMFLAARTGNSAISVGGLGQGMSTGFGSGYGGQRITLKGYSYDKLLQLAKNLRQRLKQNRRVRSVDINGSGFFNRGDLFQYYLRLKDEKLAALGLNRRQLYASIALDVSPENGFGRVNLNGNQMYLIGRNRIRQLYPASLMEEKRVGPQDTVIFSLEQVAALDKRGVQSQIRREDQSYIRVVTVDFLGPYRLARDYITAVLKETPVPVGMNIEYGNGFFSFGNDDDTWNIMWLLFLTIVTVWMISAAVLENWLDPLIVILTVPLALLGIMAGALYTGMPFDRGAIAGVMLCVGVVVNNAILLMYEKQKYRRLHISGLRSWLYVYHHHIRAVLITTLTTIGGLLPMIIFGESEFWNQLASVTTWGLAVGTTMLLLLTGIWEKTGLKKVPKNKLQNSNKLQVSILKHLNSIKIGRLLSRMISIVSPL